MRRQVSIGIIGGTGAMGRWFETFFTRAGHRVLVSGRKTDLRPRDLAEQCQVVIISVPIDASEQVSEEVGPFMTEDQLLTDFCSLKKKIVTSMLRSTRAEVAGVHPLFGPFMDAIRGQNVILCPARGSRWPAWLEDEFTRYGAVVKRMDPATHDRNMAVFQGLTHLLTVSMARTLQKINMNPAEAIRHSTPVFRINADLMGRLFAQDLGLYARLIGENPHVGDMLNLFVDSLNEARDALLSGDVDAGGSFLENIQKSLGDFCAFGLEESNAFLNLLYSRTKPLRTRAAPATPIFE